MGRRSWFNPAVMKLAELTPEAIERAIDELYSKVSGHVASRIHAVSLARYSIPRERRRIGPRLFRYHMASDVDLLFRFALGEAEASAVHIAGLCDTVLDLLHIAPLGRVAEDWKTLRCTSLGVAVLAARARVKLRDDDETLSATQVELLSGLTKRKLTAAKIPKERGGYPAPAVRRWFDKEGVRS